MRQFHKWRPLLAGILAAVVLCAQPAGTSVTLQAATASELQNSIKEKEKQISDAQNEKKQLQASLSDVKSMVKGLQNSKNDLEAYVTQLDANLEIIQDKIADLKDMITRKEAEVAQAKADLDAAVEREEAQYQAMKTRIKYSYETSKDGGYAQILLSGGFGDMLNRAEYIESMNLYDQEQLAEYIANRELVAACKAGLEEEQSVLEEAKSQVEIEESNLETLIAEKEKEIEAYRQEIANKESEIKEYEAYVAAQNATIAALEAAAEAERKQLEELNKPKITYDGGVFCLPLASYTRISDEYGNRMHPTLKINKFHNGIDFAAPAGTAIYAAYKGNVVAAAYNATMGNYVMINHGDGLYTIYMHASKLFVSTGQSVDRGQKIAAVGTTGRSTGNHLHFGVRENGNYVNPAKYLR